MTVSGEVTSLERYSRRKAGAQDVRESRRTGDQRQQQEQLPGHSGSTTPWRHQLERCQLEGIPRKGILNMSWLSDIWRETALSSFCSAMSSTSLGTGHLHCHIRVDVFHGL